MSVLAQVRDEEGDGSNSIAVRGMSLTHGRHLAIVWATVCNCVLEVWRATLHLAYSYNSYRQENSSMSRAGRIGRHPKGIQAISERSNFPRLILLLLFVVGFGLQADDCLAQAEEVNSFRPITIDEAPPELRQEIEITRAASPYDFRLKMAGGLSHEPGAHLTIVRIENNQCEDKFCPTYIKYDYNNGTSAPAVQTLLMKCDEWLFDSDTIAPSLRSSSGEVVGIAISITVKTTVGLAEVNFTRLGPAVSFLKP